LSDRLVSFFPILPRRRYGVNGLMSHGGLTLAPTRFIFIRVLQAIASKGKGEQVEE